MNATRTAAAVAAAALAALILSGCGLIGSVLTGTPEGEQDVFSIKIGDCLNDAQIDEEVTSVPFADCAEPHDSEVFASGTATGDTFPGNDPVFAQLDEFCQGDVYTEFVGIPYDDSMYYTSGYVPTAESWLNGDRELLCTIWDENGQVTGSLAGVAK